MPGIDDADSVLSPEAAAPFARVDESCDAASPSTEIKTIGPWCGGDSRAYHQPIAAAPATATKNNVRMRVTCHWRTLVRACFDIQYSGACGAAQVLPRFPCSLSRRRFSEGGGSMRVDLVRRSGYILSQAGARFGFGRSSNSDGILSWGALFSTAKNSDSSSFFALPWTAAT